MKRFLKIILLFILANSVVYSQGLENIIVNMAADIASNYIRPLASTFGSNLNSDWVTKIPSSTKNNFNVQVRLITTGSFFAGEDRNFNTIGTYRLNFNDVERLLRNSGIKIEDKEYLKIQSYLLAYPIDVFVEGPTVIGSDKEYIVLRFPETIIEGKKIKEMEFTSESAKGLLGSFDLLPNFTLQVNLGTFCGTNISGRYLPSLDIPNVGRFSYWGLGIISNPSKWLMNLKYIDYGLGFFHQKMTVGNIFEGSATTFGLYFGKTFGDKFKISPLINIQYEISSISVSYIYSFKDEYYGFPVRVEREIGFKLNGRNKFSSAFGLNLEYSFLSLNAGFKFARTNTLKAGLGFAF